MRRRAFTLLELIVVVAILGIIAAIFIPNMFPREDRRKETLVIMKDIIHKVERYRVDNGRYPTTAQGLSALVTPPSEEPRAAHWKQYLQQIPKDAWGNEFVYVCPDSHAPFEIRSAGDDGQLNTADDIAANQLISNAR